MPSSFNLVSTRFDRLYLHSSSILQALSSFRLPYPYHVLIRRPIYNDLILLPKEASFDLSVVSDTKPVCEVDSGNSRYLSGYLGSLDLTQEPEVFSL
ncbi:hypothetical protein N8657_00935, partial [bacterium]|nr:hypothetical protein [bacterium]